MPPGTCKYRLAETLPQKGDAVLFCPPDTALFQKAKDFGYLHAGLFPVC